MAKIKQSEIQEKHLWLGGGLLLVVLLIYVAGRASKAKAEAKEPEQKQIVPNVAPIPIVTPQGTVNWDASPLVKEIFTAYQPSMFSSGRCTVLNKLVLLRDNQLQAVAQGYQGTYGDTLRATLEGANYACWNLPWEDDPHTQVIQRLDTLQIA